MLLDTFIIIPSTPTRAHTYAEPFQICVQICPSYVGPGAVENRTTLPKHTEYTNDWTVDNLYCSVFFGHLVRGKCQGKLRASNHIPHTYSGAEAEHHEYKRLQVLY